MIEVYPKLWVGDDDDAEVWLKTGLLLSWSDSQKRAALLEKISSGDIRATVSAAKEPYHRKLVGYTGRAAPEGPERYAARRGRHLALNWVDVDDPTWFRASELREALMHIEAAQRMEIDCLVHCNQGVSRSPSLALAWLYTYGPDEWGALTHERAEEKFKAIYPAYDPTSGVREFIREALW